MAGSLCFCALLGPERTRAEDLEAMREPDRLDLRKSVPGKLSAGNVATSMDHGAAGQHRASRRAGHDGQARVFLADDKAIHGDGGAQQAPRSAAAETSGRRQAEVVVDALAVAGADQSDRDQSGETGARSVVDGKTLQTRFAGEPQMALRSLPGVFTRQSSDQPGIEVNICGLSGYGRVNTMIDGVPQTFRNVASHASSGGSLLYVHPDLLADIDVTRGAVAGAQGSGTLAGAANFHTLEAADVMADDKDHGALIRLKAGDNGPRYSSALAWGQRWKGLWGGEGQVETVAALAWTRSGVYRAGGRARIPSGPQGQAADDAPRSGLVKLDARLGAHHDLKLGARWYGNRFDNSSYGWSIDNRTWTAAYAYTPDSDWLDVDLKAWLNDTRLTYAGSDGGYAGRRTEDRNYGLSADNHMRVPLGDRLQLQARQGFSWGREDFQTHARRGGNHPGVLDKASLYADAALDIGRYAVYSGLRYDRWRLHGWRAPYGAGMGDCPAAGRACGNDWVTHAAGQWLPRIGMRLKLGQAWQMHLEWAHTFRPPTSHEAFFALVPFGAGVGSGIANNLDLKPEQSRGWDLGTDYASRSLWRDDDRLSWHLGLFFNSISHYIVNDFVEIPGGGETAMWVNRSGRIRNRGLEAEGSYDAGPAYARFSFSATHTGQPLGDGTGAGNGEASLLPARVATLDLGMQLLGRRLDLGVQGRYVGKGREAVYDWYSFVNTWGRTKAYTLVDMHGSYALGRNSRLFFTIENLADRRYGYAGSGYNTFVEQYGRGRSLIIGFSGRF